MELNLYQPPEQTVMWHITSSGRQRIAPGKPYWFDNHDRVPADSVVAQVSLAGSIVYRDPQGEHLVRAGTLLLFSYGEPTSYGIPRPTNEAYECQWLNMRGAGLREHINTLRQKHGSILRLGRGATLLRDIGQLSAMAIPGQNTSTRDMASAIHRFVMNLFAHAERQLDEALSPVQRAVQQLLREPTRPWSLKQLAQEYDCSREHLTRVFHESVGQSPAAYLAQARLRKAMHLLTETNLPLADVAEQAGFAHVHTLARQVRQATGKPPSAHRPKR